MKKTSVRLVLFLNYFVFAVLLNTVGAVILQVQVLLQTTKSEVSVLEGFKDISIAAGSFFLASWIPKLGYKRAMLISLAIVSVVCFVMPFADAFWYFKLLFLSVGISFALVKISVFSTIGLITESSSEHASFMNLLESVFMIGVLFGNVLFSLFVKDDNASSREWLQVYWILGGLSFMAFVVLFFTKIDQSKIQEEISSSSLQKDFSSMLLLVGKPLVLVFIFSVAFYVLIEQSFSTWMPTFYKEILKFPNSMSIQAGVILAGSVALGRFLAGIILRKIGWFQVVVVCLLCCAVCILIVLSLSKNITPQIGITWWNAPMVAYLFPMMGLFLAPIYPAINSLILNTLPKHQHSAMTGLIVIFSALGGTFGSILTGNMFQRYGGSTAFQFSLFPILVLIFLLWLFRRKMEKA